MSTQFLPGKGFVDVWFYSPSLSTRRICYVWGDRYPFLPFAENRDSIFDVPDTGTDHCPKTEEENHGVKQYFRVNRFCSAE